VDFDNVRSPLIEQALEPPRVYPTPAVGCPRRQSAQHRTTPREAARERAPAPANRHLLDEGAATHERRIDARAVWIPKAQDGDVVPRREPEEQLRRRLSPVPRVEARRKRRTYE